jgi:hypothetical protein
MESELPCNLTTCVSDCCLMFIQSLLYLCFRLLPDVYSVTVILVFQIAA